MRGGLSTFVGTSQATPHAAGAAAVLLEVNPQLTPADIERILESTGKPLLDARNGVTTPRVDVLAAVQAARPAGGGVRRRRSAHP